MLNEHISVEVIKNVINRNSQKWDSQGNELVMNWTTEIKMPAMLHITQTNKDVDVCKITETWEYA